MYGAVKKYVPLPDFLFFGILVTLKNKHNPNKYKIDFLNDVTFIKGQKLSKSIWPYKKANCELTIFTNF